MSKIAYRIGAISAVLVSVLVAVSTFDAPGPLRARHSSQGRGPASERNPRAESLLLIPSASEFVRLPRSERNLLIEAMRMAAIDAESASRRARGVRDSTSAMNALQSLLLSVAHAQGNDPLCSEAGWLWPSLGVPCVSRDLTTPSCQGRIGCNPLLYGARVCAPRGGNSASACNQNGRPAAEVAQTIVDGSMFTLWDEFSQQLRGECARDRTSSTCRAYIGRFDQVNDVIRRQRSGAAPVSVAPPGRDPGAPRGDEVRPEPGRCVQQGLLSDVTTPGAEYVRGDSIMTLEQAHRFMCSSEPLSEGEVRFVRERRSWLAGLRAAVGADRTPQGNYMRIYLESLLVNFDACVARAESMRRSSAGAAPRPAAGPPPNVDISCTANDICTLTSGERSVVVHRSQIGGGLSFVAPPGGARGPSGEDPRSDINDVCLIRAPTSPRSAVAPRLAEAAPASISRPSGSWTAPPVGPVAAPAPATPPTAARAASSLAIQCPGGLLPIAARPGEYCAGTRPPAAPAASEPTQVRR